jgi:hypothetical protein
LEATKRRRINYTESTKAVLVITGTPDLIPPNFKAMLDMPGVNEVVSSVYGELEGCVTKHIVGSTWGNRDRGGGVYFFTDSNHIEAYLASATWTDLYHGTPWSDVEYAKYELVND